MLSRSELTRLGYAYRVMAQRNARPGERAEIFRMLRKLQTLPKGSREREMAMTKLQKKAFGGDRPPVFTPTPAPPPKGIVKPAPTPQAPTPTPTATPAPVETATPAPTETPAPAT
jgi:hypothetical protein